jgi:hypothetical protein
MATLESCQIAIQPGSDMINTRVEQTIQVRPNFCDEFRVGHELPRRARDPGLQQGDKLHLNLCWWNWLSVRGSENGCSVIVCHDETRVEILGTWSGTEVHTLMNIKPSRAPAPGRFPRTPSQARFVREQRVIWHNVRPWSLSRG